MKDSMIIRLLCYFTLLFISSVGVSCEEEEVDYFIGSWEFNVNSITTTFDLRKSGTSYVIENASLNGSMAITKEIGAVNIARYIEMVVITNSNGSSIEFVNLKPIEGGKKIFIDAIEYSDGSPNPKTLFSDMTLVRVHH